MDFSHSYQEKYLITASYFQMNYLHPCSDIFIKTRQGRGNSDPPIKGDTFLPPALRGNPIFNDPTHLVVKNMGKDTSQSKIIQGQQTKLSLPRKYGFNGPFL